MKKSISLSVGISLCFFILGLITLPHYGTNWDTINHLPRGQAYLHFFLTGKKDYSDLPIYFDEWEDPDQWYYQNPNNLKIDTNLPKDKIPERSMYQTKFADFNYFISSDAGHPPLSDELSSVFNRVLFGKLKLINDIDSYRVYGVFLASLLVGLIFWWGSKSYGIFAGLISALSLVLYPLFWSESHFNTEKDIPEAVFWAFALFTVWRGMIAKKKALILLSGIFFGLALGTKVNIIFSIFVLIPWLAAFLWGKKPHNYITTVLVFLTIPLLSGGIFIASWPYLWADLPGRIWSVLKYYQSIGLSNQIDARFLGPFGINTHPAQWIIFTTPLIILTFSLIGILAAIYKTRLEKDKTSFLFLLWLFVPIIRISWPGANSYGGVRQVMEFIPAMALMSGLGAASLGELVQKGLTFLPQKRRHFVVMVALLCCFIPITLKLISMHPNENVYFNPLIGGLKGAQSKNFPYWGFSFGGPYRQAAVWLNKNAPKGSHLAFAYELIPNIPRIFLRNDFDLHPKNQSGSLNNGEYAVGLIYQGTGNRSYYESYLENFLEPVYQEKVDGVSILKIWKNDKEHLKGKQVEVEEKNVKIRKTSSGIRIELAQVRKLSKLEINYSTDNCLELKSGHVQISASDENKWENLPGELPDQWRIAAVGYQPKNGKFIELFAGSEAKYINIILEPYDTCLTNVKSYNMYYLNTDL